jgi:hypothetical protein
MVLVLNRRRKGDGGLGGKTWVSDDVITLEWARLRGRSLLESHDSWESGELVETCVIDDRRD